jgi:hypothetical protein
MTPETNVFSRLPPTAESHFRLFYYSAIARLIDYVQRVARASGEPFDALLQPYEFLSGYAEELRACTPPEMGAQEARGWWRAQMSGWESATGARLPLRELAERLRLSEGQLTALVLAGVVEEDIRFGSLFAALQEPLPARRPCLGLLGALACEGGRNEQAGDWWAAALRLMEAGLLAAENRDAPRSEWVVRVPTQLWDTLRGRAPERIGAACRIYPRREFPPLKELILDESLRGRLCGLPSAVAGGQLSAIILRGMAGSGRRIVMGSLARSMRRDLLFYDCRAQPTGGEEFGHLAGPIATLTGAFPVFAIDPAPGETFELPRLKGYEGAVGVVMRGEGGVAGTCVERAVTLSIPAPALEHRRSLWQRSLAGCAGEDLADISERFLLPLGNVERVASVAAGYARLERRDRVTAADVQLACRSLNRQKLDTLAQRLEVSGGWDELVVNDETAAELRQLEHRCRHRERLLHSLGAGFRNSINCGVRALFNGPSGTGKTLAAKILAAVLQTDVYRVDLAATVNKYIGETEKNLSQLLARAEELDVILLVDEGDALMSNRTDVKSSNDRYANLETNYLLQRLETFQGVVIVTTNGGSRIDQAFQRRFDVSINFYPPDAAERSLIWQLHLPPAHRVSGGRLQEIAHCCALTGGEIRNAALHASLLAVSGGRDGQVSDADLETAVRREYRKAGGSCPLQPSPGPNGHLAALNQFLADIC